ncbi:MAG: tetratricopeptide repeat protein [Candidatus Rokubacteria bacterium]|nr:tetratricopeptide repeat protein [Candidatus Rokubacteria bacterium]
MFCRSCWTNIPDGSPQCPKCEGDPRAAPSTGAETSKQAPAPGSAPAPGKSDATSRLTAGLLLVLGVMVAGLLVTRWLERPARQETGEARRPGVQGGAAPGSGQVLPAVEPGAQAGGGAEAALASEALALYRQGRVAEACERYREVAGQVRTDEARRDWGACLVRLARDAQQANDPQLAVQRYQESLEAYTASPGVWMGLALLYVRANDLDRGQRVLEQAAQFLPGDAEILYLLAEVQERRGQAREAVETLRRLLAAHPGHGRARNLLASLEREQKFEGSYWAQESRHFLVRYEGAGGIDVGRSVADILEEAYESIGRDLGAFPQDRVQVGIYTAEVLGQVLGFPAHFVRGAYDRYKIRLNLAESVAYSNDFSRLVRHEYAHVVIHLATNGRAVVWLHEGLAQVVEPRSAPRFIDVSVPREFLTLDGIGRLARGGSLEAVAAGYALSHVAAEYLVERGGMSGVREFLARLGRGEPIPDAMRGAFGFGPEEVAGRLRAAAGKS